MKHWQLIFIFNFGLNFNICSSKTGNRFPIPYTNDALIFYGGDKKPVGQPMMNYQSQKNKGNYPTERQSIFDPNHCEKTRPISCDPTSPYRNIDGSCNNLKHPSWGSVECYLRILPAFYDGFGGFRKSAKGDPLPEPRDITLNIFKQVSRLSEASLMFTYYGQTLAHDISRAYPTDQYMNCCQPENEKNPSCISIFVRNDDPFFSIYNKTCLYMRRSQTCNHCNKAKREQKNGVTPIVDGSHIYGSDDDTARKIRANDGTGKLNFRSTGHGDLLPIDKNPEKIFCPVEIKSRCLISGDKRLNQHSALSSLHTLYMREHNRIATQLKDLNPHWEEERLYQEARRINIAQLQCITYSEYLPQLLGPYIMKQFNLNVEDSSIGTKYNSNLRLGVWNEFANGVFRLHSMIASDVGALNLRFRDFFMNPYLLEDGLMDDIMRGGCKAASEKYDQWHVHDIKQSLGHKNGTILGTDLTSIDIQRGRDHGMPPYIELVKFCSNGEIIISSFRDLSPLLMSEQSVKFLEENFKAVEDVDLYVGLQMEHLYPESEVGPTAACMIAKQFYFFKFADRFYFEHEGEMPSFSPAQRNSLKQCSFSRILCDNIRIRQIQRNAMLVSSAKNPRISCEEIPAIDIMPWKETIPA